MSLFVTYLEIFVQSIPLILILIIAKYFFDKRRLFALGKRLPGPRPWPIIGNALDFLGKDLDFLSKITKLNEKHGLVAFWIGYKLQVLVSTPEDAEAYFASRQLLDKDEMYTFIEAILGKGLITANGMEWKKARKFIEPAFRYSSLQSFIPIYQEQANILLQCLKQEEGKGNFSVFPYIKRCTFDIICEAAMPLGINAQKGGEVLKIMENSNAIMIGIKERIFSLWQRFDFIYKLTKKGEDLFRKIAHTRNFIGLKVQERKAAYDTEKISPKGEKGPLETQILLERFFENKEWDEVTLTDHILTMIGAGNETSATAVSFILLMLGIHKDVQEKLYQELRTAFENGMSEEYLYRLEYLDMVIKETLRLFPIVPYIFRKASQDVQIGNHLIPKGASVGVNIFALHRNPHEYENPEAFNPDNFLPENVQKRHSYSFIPFAMGVRMCIGNKFALMSIRIIVSKIVRSYKIECDLKLKDIRVRDQISLKTKDGLYPIRITKR